MQEHKNFWDKNAGRYDRFMRKDRAAYDEMYELIQPVVRHKTGLELATGTGLIAKKHRKRGGAHRGDGRLRRNDRRSETGQSLGEAALFRAGYVPPALCEPVL